MVTECKRTFHTTENVRLYNLKRRVLYLAGGPWRTKFLFKNLLGLFSIQPIIRFVLVWLFLRLERFSSKNAVAKNWAFRLVHSSPKTRMYGRMYGNVPYIRHHNQPVVSARNTKKSWKRCPLLCLSPENDVTFNAYHMGPSTMSPFMLIIRMTSPFMLIIAFYAYQSVEKTLYHVYSKQGLFSERSVQVEFSLPPKQSMSRFNFTSLILSS